MIKKIYLSLPFLFITSIALSSIVALRFYSSESEIIKKYNPNNKLLLSEKGKITNISQMKEEFVSKSKSFKDNFIIKNITNNFDFEFDWNSKNTVFKEDLNLIENLWVKVFDKNKQNKKIWRKIHFDVSNENSNEYEEKPNNDFVDLSSISSETTKVLGVSLKENEINKNLIASEFLKQYKNKNNEIFEFFKLNTSKDLSKDISYSYEFTPETVADDFKGTISSLKIKFFFTRKPHIFQYIEYSDISGFKKMLNLKQVISNIKNIRISEKGKKTTVNIAKSEQENEFIKNFEIELVDNDLFADIGIRLIKPINSEDYNSSKGFIQNIQVQLFQKTYPRNFYNSSLIEFEGFKKG